MRRVLWSVEASGLRDPARLSDGLYNLLQVSEAQTIVVTNGEQAQAYLLLEGCVGCAMNRCEAGCRSALFQRVMAQSFEQSTLRVVKLGLRPRPYQLTVLAWPTSEAKPLDLALLAEWSEARLAIHWHLWPLRKGAIAATALLRVGEGNDDPRARLKAYGWRGVVIPRWLPLFSPRGVPKPLPPGLLYPRYPSLLLPHDDEVQRIEVMPVPEPPAQAKKKKPAAKAAQGEPAQGEPAQGEPVQGEPAQGEVKPAAKTPSLPPALAWLLARLQPKKKAADTPDQETQPQEAQPQEAHVNE